MFFLVGMLLFVGILAGSYPAFYISRFEPISILKGKLKFGGTNYFTRVLLALQFSVSLIAIISAVGFLQNARYQREYDLGFDVRGSILAWVSNKSDYDTYLNALQGNPDITAMAGSSSGIFSSRGHDPIKYDSRQIEVDVIYVGDEYRKTIDLELLQGRDFIKDSKTDQQESIIITQKMAGLFGNENPIGKQIIWRDSIKLFVVGVVKDVYTRGLWTELDPMMIRFVPPTEYNQIVVSTKAENVPAVNEFMKKQWAKVFPNKAFDSRMLVSNMHEIDNLNMSIVYMYTFLGALALILSATGLFTLVSMNIISRMKEIGVRKVLGASVLNITRIVNTEFIIILLAASVLGSWSAYKMSNIIMGSIWKYYQGVNTLTFIVSIGLVFTVSFLTIGYKVFSVATMNPVKTLRDE
jgi:ABC-type antimicrobial peptide transport system permease subunit